MGFAGWLSIDCNYELQIQKFRTYLFIYGLRYFKQN